MRLSIFTAETNPKERGDLTWQAHKCYTELADRLGKV